MRKRTVAIPLCALAAAGLAGGAFAATQSSSNPQQAFLTDVAHRLDVSPGRLASALRQAFLDRINAAVSAGRLTPAQAKAIKARVEQGHGVPLMPLVPGPGRFGPRLIGPPPFGAGPPGPPPVLGGAARYLGLTDQQLIGQLRSGKTLAQIASARGKSKIGLEHAIVAAFKARLGKATAAGRVPPAIEQRILKAFSQHIQDLVNGRPPAVLHRGWAVHPAPLRGGGLGGGGWEVRPVPPRGGGLGGVAVAPPPGL
jgi:hypothetical protein